MRPLTRRAPEAGVVDLREPGGAGSVAVISDREHDVTHEMAVVVAQASPGRQRRPRRRRGPCGLIGSVLVTWAAVMAGFVIFVVFLSAFPQSRAQAGLQRSFATTLAYAEAPVGGNIRPGTPVARLDIPAIGVHEIVVEGTSADQLRKGAGHLRVSPLPGQAGNSVLLGHALAYGAPFGSIGSLRPGDLIHVLTGQGGASYRVTGHSTVPDKDTRPFQATRDNRLTLVTAADVWAGSRLVVTADLQGNPEPAPIGKPSALAPAEGGLAGASGGAGLVGLWSAVFLAVAAVTVLAYRRLPRWSSYVITTPIVLGSLWLLYATVGRFIPGTL